MSFSALNRLLHLCLVLLFALAFPAFAQASNFVVSTTADSGPGSLRQAILDSNLSVGGAHLISFSATFPANGVILLNSNLPPILAQNVNIEGVGKQPHIDGRSLHSLFSVSSDTSVFKLIGLVLQNALAPDYGACINSGISGSTGELYVHQVTFSNCKAKGPSLIRGGAISWGRSEGFVFVGDSQFFNNSVEATAANGQSEGGALYTSADLIVARTLFESNTARAKSGGGGLGGAISVYGINQFSNIEESTFLFNNASPTSSLFGYGGAIYFACDDCAMQIRQSYMRGNSANYGGAIYARKPSVGTADVFLTLSNSTFYNSSVINEGAAVYVGNKASLSALNNTFYNGDAASGAHLGFFHTAEVSFFRANLLAATYRGTACTGTPTITAPGFVGSNLFTDASCGSLAAGALPNSPLGVVAVDETPGLIGVLRFSGSAVIDSITTASICQPRDARDQTRPIDGDGDGTAYCDVGAFEAEDPIKVFSDSFEI